MLRVIHAPAVVFPLNYLRFDGTIRGRHGGRWTQHNRRTGLRRTTRQTAAKWRRCGRLCASVNIAGLSAGKVRNCFFLQLQFFNVSFHNHYSFIDNKWIAGSMMQQLIAGRRTGFRYGRWRTETGAYTTSVAGEHGAWTGGAADCPLLLFIIQRSHGSFLQFKFFDIFFHDGIPVWIKAGKKLVTKYGLATLGTNTPAAYAGIS